MIITSQVWDEVSRVCDKFRQSICKFRVLESLGQQVSKKLLGTEVLSWGWPQTLCLVSDYESQGLEEAIDKGFELRGSLVKDSNSTYFILMTKAAEHNQNLNFRVKEFGNPDSAKSRSLQGGRCAAVPIYPGGRLLGPSEGLWVGSNEDSRTQGAGRKERTLGKRRIRSKMT